MPRSSSSCPARAELWTTWPPHRAGYPGPTRLEMVDLDALLGVAYAATGRGEPRRPGMARAAGVERTPAADAHPVLADPLRIAQACANLVGNAAEHGGGAVRVRGPGDRRGSGSRSPTTARAFRERRWRRPPRRAPARRPWSWARDRGRDRRASTAARARRAAGRRGLCSRSRRRPLGAGVRTVRQRRVAVVTGGGARRSAPGSRSSSERSRRRTWPGARRRCTRSSGR